MLDFRAASARGCRPAWEHCDRESEPPFAYSPDVRRWVKIALIVVVVGAALFLALAGTGAYYFLRHLETRTASEKQVQPDFDAVRTRFGARQALIEIIDPAKGDVRINRSTHPEGRRASTLHVLTWEGDESRQLRTDVPLWLMRFSSVNVLSQVGIAPSRYRLTVQDIERYGPGIVVDFRREGEHQVLIWVE